MLYSLLQYVRIQLPLHYQVAVYICCILVILMSNFWVKVIFCYQSVWISFATFVFTYVCVDKWFFFIIHLRLATKSCWMISEKKCRKRKRVHKNSCLMVESRNTRTKSIPSRNMDIQIIHTTFPKGSKPPKMVSCLGIWEKNNGNMIARDGYTYVIVVYPCTKRNLKTLEINIKNRNNEQSRNDDQGTDNNNKMQIKLSKYISPISLIVILYIAYFMQFDKRILMCCPGIVDFKDGEDKD